MGRALGAIVGAAVLYVAWRLAQAQARHQQAVSTPRKLHRPDEPSSFTEWQARRQAGLIRGEERL